MIIALDINAEYIISRAVYQYKIPICWKFGECSIMNQLYHSFKIPRLFLQLQISMFKCKWGICAKVDR